METVATHLMVPVVVALALAYAAELLERLRAERVRRERLAVEAERRRIAWELHDSAKQRVHAAALVLSAVQPTDSPARRGIHHALAELRAAAADMDTSVAELREPLSDGPMEELLRERARDLAAVSDADIVVSGALPTMPPVLAMHAYRIAAEALTNAVRHANASQIEVRLEGATNPPAIRVRDDGVGLPADARPGSHGVRFMRARAESIGGHLEMDAGPGGAGTVVTLTLPPLLPHEKERTT